MLFRAQEVCDDYSSNVGWLQESTGTCVVGGVVQYLNCGGASSRRIWKNHGVTLTNCWRLDLDFNFTGYESGGPGHILACVTAGNIDPISSSGGTPWAATDQDAIFVTFASIDHTNIPSTFKLQGYAKNGTVLGTATAGITLAINTTYFIRLERLDLIHGSISVYTDAAYTVLFDSQDFLIDSGVSSNLPFIQHGVTSWAGPDRDMTGSVDNTCFQVCDLNNGIETKVVENRTINIFPNPSNGIIEIESNLLPTDSGSYIIIDISGQVVSQGVLNYNENKPMVNLEELNSGVYFCNFTVNNELIKTEKLVVVK